MPTLGRSQIKSAQAPGSTWQGHRRAPYREAFISDVKSWVPRTGRQGYESTPTSEGHTSRVPNYVGRAVDIPEAL
jgi:hypothetical protein